MFSKVLIQLQVSVLFFVLVVAAFFGDEFVKPIFKESGAICFTIMLCTLAICHSIEKRK